MAGASRLTHLPPNFAPIGAIALFGGAYFSNRLQAFLIPLLAMLLSDIIIGFHNWSVMVSVYGSFTLIVCIGVWISKNRSILRIAGTTLSSSILFFAVTNFVVWATAGGLGYAMTIKGLGDCYIVAIPFFGNTLLGDAFYTFVLFGGFALMEYRIPQLREARATA